MFWGNMIMQRTLYAYKIQLQPVSKNKPFVLKNFEDDFITVLEELMAKKANERKHDFSQDKKILYLDNYEYYPEHNMVNIKLLSAKYDARRRVVDTDTLNDKGILKSFNDGDEEKNHICIKFLKDNVALCLQESNYYGVGMGKIILYLQKAIKSFHKNQKDGCYYNLIYENIVSRDFLEALAKLRRVKAVKLTVDQEEVSVSDFKDLSGRADISPNVEILLKPTSSKMGIHKDTVKDFFKIYNDPGRRVKRVTVEGDGESKEVLSFDTEQMKQKIIVTVERTEDTGEVSTNSIFTQMYVEMLQLE